jgi:hypothetical protein
VSKRNKKSEVKRTKRSHQKKEKKTKRKKSREPPHKVWKFLILLPLKTQLIRSRWDKLAAVTPKAIIQMRVNKT